MSFCSCAVNISLDLEMLFYFKMGLNAFGEWVPQNSTRSLRRSQPNIRIRGTDEETGGGY